ncbi:uncharacterized protein LOC135957545 [Calliphora vicina]|uniref:uncharacterized protein LOC135957545 n=1 Tax=Calliphora vicina TaxID=7373 RepID=UPI00325A79B9
MKVLPKTLNKILFYLQLVTLSLACNLKYSNKEWLDEWRLLVIQDANNQYQLLRDHNVDANQMIYMLCDGQPKLITATCNANQRFDKALPLAEKCPDRESIVPVRFAEKVSYCPYTLYKIGFNIVIDSRTQFLETYRVCFDQKHMRPVFTVSKAYPVGGGRPGFLQFNPDDIFYGRHFSAFSRKNTFERFNKSLGNTQTYMNPKNLDHIIDRGHLTPSADFTLTNLKRSTFNMINVIPQFKTIDNGNWRLIEEWTRHSTRTPGHICTGVLDCNLDATHASDLNCIVKLQDAKGKWVPMFLADNRKIPIPLWSYKIVKNKETSLVFLTLNNIYHKGEVQVPQDVCQQIECPLALTQTIKEGRTFCCSYNEFINKNVPHLRGVC